MFLHKWLYNTIKQQKYFKNTHYYKKCTNFIWWNIRLHFSVVLKIICQNYLLRLGMLPDWGVWSVNISKNIEYANIRVIPEKIVEHYLNVNLYVTLTINLGLEDHRMIFINVLAYIEWTLGGWGGILEYTSFPICKMS